MVVYRTVFLSSSSSALTSSFLAHWPLQPGRDAPASGPLHLLGLCWLALCSAKPTVHSLALSRSLLNAAYQRGFLWAAVKLPALPTLPSLLLLFWPHHTACWTSPTRDWTCVLCIRRQILNRWTPREVPVVFFIYSGYQFFVLCAAILFPQSVMVLSPSCP